MIEVMIEFKMGTTVMQNVYIAEADPSERVTSIKQDPTWVVGPIVRVEVLRLTNMGSTIQPYSVATIVTGSP